MKPDAWSFDPPTHQKKLGESPFRIRGSVYAGYLEVIGKQVPGGLTTVCRQIGNKNIELFLRETIFLAASIYDMEPLMHIMRVLARLNQTPLDKFARDAARIAAERDVVGKYRAQLRSASPEEMATRLPRIFIRYFEPCQAEAQNGSAAATEMRFSGLPASAMGFYTWQTEGFVSGALESVGAREIRFSWNTPVPSGEVDGAPVQNLSCRITWTNSAI